MISYLGDVLITFGANRDKLLHVIILAIELIMLCICYKPWKYDLSKDTQGTVLIFTRVREAHPTHGAGEVVLVIEALPGLHGAVGDVLRADGADHGAHGDPGCVVSAVSGRY